METFCTRIKSLDCHNFRLFEHIALDFSTPITVITGPNGSGKTTLLEALSWLSPGRGLRNVVPAQISRHTHQQAGWGVSTELENIIDGTVYRIKTGLPVGENNTRRFVILDGKNTNANALAPLCRLLWFTPQMDCLLQESLSLQRKFFDRLVWALYPEYLDSYIAYDRWLRERNALLKHPQTKQACDWLTQIEHHMAQHAASIMQYRRQFIHDVNNFLQQDVVLPWSCYPQRIALNDNDIPRDNLVTFWQERWMQYRHQDFMAGRTIQGVHRLNWQIFMNNRTESSRMSDYSSGEQKQILLTLLLTAVHIMVAQGNRPILLLDDITAHLDHDKCQQIFSLLHDMPIQIFLTGVFPEPFQTLPSTKTTFLNMTEKVGTI